MLDDDQQGDGALRQRRRRGAGGRDEKPGEDGKAGGADDGRRRRRMRLRAKTTAKTPMAASAARGEATRKTPNPVATPLPPRKRSQQVNMWPRTAKRAASACARAQRDVGHEKRAEQAAEPDRGAALEHVEKKRGGAQAFAAGAQNIGSADVAAADGANVLVAEDADQQVSHGDGPEQVGGGRDNEACEEHDESEFSR